jgi:hypothetical protein
MVLPHARALLEHTTPDTATTRPSWLLDELGRYLKGRGDLGTAIFCYQDHPLESRRGAIDVKSSPHGQSDAGRRYRRTSAHRQ